MKKLVILFLLVAAPLSAQTIPADFHGWFLNQVAGKPFSQQTLLALAPSLPCVGSQLTPPNAKDERTKIWDPNAHRWVRVGFGDRDAAGNLVGWVWMYQEVLPDPAPQPCEVLKYDPPPVIPSLDLSAVYARIDTITAQNERIYADLVKRFDALERNDFMQIKDVYDLLKQHDEQPSYLSKIFGNKYVQMLLAAVGTCASTTCWK